MAKCQSEHKLLICLQIDKLLFAIKTIIKPREGLAHALYITDIRYPQTDIFTMPPHRRLCPQRAAPLHALFAEIQFSVLQLWAAQLQCCRHKTGPRLLPAITFRSRSTVSELELAAHPHTGHRAACLMGLHSMSLKLQMLDVC